MPARRGGEIDTMFTREHERKVEADALYERHGRPLEAAHRGQFVAISPRGETILAPTVLEVVDKALAAFGPGSYVFKVVDKAVWRWR
jgi:hypothetical protein